MIPPQLKSVATLPREISDPILTDGGFWATVAYAIRWIA